MKAAPWILATVAAVVLVVSLVQRAEAVARADVHEERADSLAVLDAAHQSREAIHTEQIDALTDSLTDARAETERARAESAVRISRSEERAVVLDADVRARVDAAGDSAFTAYVAERDARDAEYVRIIATLESDVEGLTLALAEERQRSQGRLEGWNGARGEVAELRAANASLRNAVAPSFWTGLLDHWELVALGAGLGIVTWEIAR